MASIKKDVENGRKKSSSMLVMFVVAIALTVLVGALFIPFVYESKTLWYKIGLDKTMLRLGKMSGLTAAYLIYLQILLGARGPLWEKLFSVATIMKMHRINGLLIAFFAIAHVSLVLIPEGIANLPLGWKYWPELIGATLLALLLFQVFIAQYRQQLKIQYPGWRLSHKVLGYLLLFIIPGHVLWVSDSFEAGLPKYGLLIFVLFVIFLILINKILIIRRSGAV